VKEKTPVVKQLYRLSIEPRVVEQLGKLAERLRDLFRLRAQRLGIGLAHVGKADAEVVDVRSAQRVHAHQIDVIGDEHQIAGLELGVDSAGGVGDDELFDAQAADDAR